MRFFALAAVFTFILSASASADWANIPLDRLVQDSDLIVVGTLSQVSQYSDGETDYGQGTITVHQVIWGDVQTNELLTLKWQNPTGRVCPRVEHSSEQGQKAIWLLTKESAGEVRADYPSRFVDLADRAKIERILRSKNVCLRVQRWVIEPSEPAMVSIVLRNPTDQAAEFPGLIYVNGILYMDPTFSLGVYTNSWKEQQGLYWTRVEWIPNRVVVIDGLAPTTVLPNEEFRLTINLKDLVEMSAGESHQVRFEAQGHAAANSVDIFTQEADRHHDSAGFGRSTTNRRYHRVTLGVGSMMALVGSACS